MTGRILPALALLVLVSSPALAQFAVETAPGVHSYGGETMSVETMPGYHRFSGAVEGSAIQIAPGLGYYNLRPEHWTPSSNKTSQRRASGVPRVMPPRIALENGSTLAIGSSLRASGGTDQVIMGTTHEDGFHVKDRRLGTPTGCPIGFDCPHPLR